LPEAKVRLNQCPSKAHIPLNWSCILPQAAAEAEAEAAIGKMTFIYVHRLFVSVENVDSIA
jgi:hypothetical protein